MSTFHYSSMRICMCQHSSPEGYRQVVAFKPFQYKQNIKKLKSAISPKSLPNISTSASGSKCPHILLDHIYPADYSQLTQSTFSTPLGLTSTPHNPFSGNPNPPTDHYK
ncbi:hypothetical protein O181_114344 [Austropuccinia psidii MF-1]|uniref:Uncharacterized protein n=1 Tax=Austropuccinia psidii MF-1 TaxID=1389203 RepID=A0A9Q3K7M6_9BASI|nr:hypothetical protein [Austropuccinia psidii MF-1]